ncbi:MAG: hypothetical protein AB7D34_01275 [Sulfurimonas sp.]
MSAVPSLLKTLDPIEQLRTAKFIVPNIFENSTPRFHIELLTFLNRPSRQKAFAVFRGGAKSTLLNKIHILNRVIFDNEPFIMIASENAKKAKSFLRDIKRNFDCAIAKGMDMKRGEVWSDNHIEIISEGKLSTIVVLGAGEDPRGYTSDNKRPTLLILDDVENRSNMKTKEQREKIGDWILQDALPALHPAGEVIWVGTIMHEDSELNIALKSDEWDSMIFSVLKDDGTSRWPTRFPLEGFGGKYKSIEEIKKGLYNRGKHKAFFQEYLCKAQSEEKQLFKLDEFQYFSHVEYSDHTSTFTFKDALNEDRVTIREPLNIVMFDGSKIAVSDCFRYATMDLASTGLDKTAITVVLVDSQRRVFLVDIVAGHFNPYEKTKAVLTVQMEWEIMKFGIEKAGMQNEFFYTLDVAQREYGIRINVEPISHGGKSKNIRIATLHPLFMTNKIFFNKSHRLTVKVEAELSAFDEELEGVHDDLIDALAYIMHFIRGRKFNSGEKVKRRPLYG